MEKLKNRLLWAIVLPIILLASAITVVALQSNLNRVAEGTPKPTITVTGTANTGDCTFVVYNSTNHIVYSADVSGTTVTKVGGSNMLDAGEYTVKIITPTYGLIESTIGTGVNQYKTISKVYNITIPSEGALTIQLGLYGELPYIIDDSWYSDYSG